MGEEDKKDAAYSFVGEGGNSRFPKGLVSCFASKSPYGERGATS